MSGFPTRSSLLAFGPEKLKDQGASLNPEKEVSAAQVNLLKWQVAGLGIVSPLASALVLDTGALSAAGAVWNPKGLPGLHPSVQKTGTGVYVVTWAVQYEDETDTMRPVSIAWARAFPQGGAFRLARTSIVGTAVTVEVAEAASVAAEDGTFLLEVG
jgi:hypothetical protein